MTVTAAAAAKISKESLINPCTRTRDAGLGKEKVEGGVDGKGDNDGEGLEEALDQPLHENAGRGTRRRRRSTVMDVD